MPSKKKAQELVITPETEAIEIGAFMREVRTMIGLSQTEVGANMGIAQTAVAKLEGGRSRPTLPTLANFAKALGLRCIVRFEP